MGKSSSQGGFFLIAIMMIGCITIVQAGLWWETSINCYSCNGWWNHCPEKNDGKIPVIKCVAKAGTIPWCSKKIRTVVEDGVELNTVQRTCFSVSWKKHWAQECITLPFGTGTWSKRCDCSSSYCNN